MVLDRSNLAEGGPDWPYLPAPIGNNFTNYARLRWFDQAIEFFGGIRGQFLQTCLMS